MFPQLATMYYVMIICGLIVPLTWLRSFKYLAFTAILGDVAIVVGVATVLIFGFINGKMSSPFDTERYVMWNWSTYPVFFGSAAFLFCIHMLVRA
jgi:amino acid permease